MSSTTSFFSGRSVPATRRVGLCRRGSGRPQRTLLGPVFASSDDHVSAIKKNNAPDSNPKVEATLTKRQLLGGAVAGIVLQPLLSSVALADGTKIVVVGATGLTGQRVVAQLKRIGGLEIVAGVRNFEKAKKMGLDKDGVSLAKIDVTGPVLDMQDALTGADVVICATGFVPGNPFKMGAEAHRIDNVGTVNLVDAAKGAGVKKFVLVSSILTNGRAWGQANSPGFKITNAFGGVLDEKIVAENHLRKSGLDYTIIRPGGLKNLVKGELAFSPEDTCASGEISRDLVAEVMARAAISPKASNKVVEIVETDTCTEGSCPADLKAAPEEPEEWEF